MRTLVVTGGIGSGKSTVCRYLALKGIPVYDSDSRARNLYEDKTFVSRLEQALRPDAIRLCCAGTVP